MIKNKKGFTLIEVIASLAVLAILATALVGIFAVSNDMLIGGSNLEKSSNEIHDYINKVKSSNPELIVEYHEDETLKINFDGGEIILTGRIVLIRNKDGYIVDYKIFERKGG